MGSQNKWIKVFAQEALSIYLYREGKVFARNLYCFLYIDNLYLYIQSFCRGFHLCKNLSHTCINKKPQVR